jgi:hypothetical protein
MGRQKERESITAGSVAKKIWSAVMFPLNFVATGVMGAATIGAKFINVVEAFFVKTATGRNLFANPTVEAIYDSFKKSFKKMLSLTFDIPVSAAQEINDNVGNIIAKNDAGKPKTKEYPSALSGTIDSKKLNSATRNSANPSYTINPLFCGRFYDPEGRGK